MPLGWLLFSNIMGGLVAFFARYFTRKVAVIAAALTVLATITGALLSTFNVVVSPLVAQLFSTQYGQLIGLAFPPVAGSCLAALGTTWSACTLYAWQRVALSISVQG